MNATPTRRKIVLGVIAATAMPRLPGFKAAAQAQDDAGLASRFQDLSQNGNATCSPKFTASIATMPPMSRIKGSCCSPMEMKRYTEQVKGLVKYRVIAMIPQDPYDIPAVTAQQMIHYYDRQLTADEQRRYDFALANSNEKGPCCCQCWRWGVYGGLAKYLIREHGFTGEQIVDVWNLSDGCGGGE
ncbi:hypothetical protein EOA75_17965 [Mesorhizobium sp. M1A.F.Ca.IN.022.07.1.1]|uniref:hypothetical protein n=1 Tax=unclassified Mesorhizobium TaxID=325217 RepID=UPI000F74D8F6|nr:MULTISPECIES: hypothetical protein [unclassified Mesorhizobium]AZO61836.1 hypothetical protein EJ078_23205 [Mesorhizobium sp. M1A.F.Ca.IN.022.06.1.1]MCT2581180.1 hypothetical protein [Mesorhizobium sp. P13.3]MDF3170190.1 hypothetical protein [Mesorhizobium sp. P16.1]MDF3181176.1 hypothetical protein [Mesorhizobium sp. P17.1]MDF3187092.1 hypothetical protein [Mesorhizobium sp. ICCV3110.1]